MELYKKCFIGLRFTSHDGLSNTVCEMGAMGRKMINNGDTPNCIPYDLNNIDKIVDDINQEYERSRGDLFRASVISNQVNEFLNIGDDFLNTEFYE